MCHSLVKTVTKPHGHQKQWAKSSETLSKVFGRLFGLWELLTIYGNMLLTVWDSEEDLWTSSECEHNEQDHWTLFEAVSKHFEGCLDCGNFWLHMKMCCSLSQTVSKTLGHHQKLWTQWASLLYVSWIHLTDKCSSIFYSGGPTKPNKKNFQTNGYISLTEHNKHNRSFKV